VREPLRYNLRHVPRTYSLLHIRIQPVEEPGAVTYKFSVAVGVSEDCCAEAITVFIGFSLLLRFEITKIFEIGYYLESYFENYPGHVTFYISSVRYSV
jgi:hypothetical protein